MCNLTLLQFQGLLKAGMGTEAHAYVINRDHKCLFIRCIIIHVNFQLLLRCGSSIVLPYLYLVSYFVFGNALFKFDQFNQETTVLAESFN